MKLKMYVVVHKKVNVKRLQQTIVKKIYIIFKNVIYLIIFEIMSFFTSPGIFKM